MEKNFFENYIEYLFKRVRLFFFVLLLITVLQYFFMMYLKYKELIPVTELNIPEWLFVAFQLGFVVLVLVIQYVFLSNGSLSRFLDRALEEAPPPQYKGDPRLFPLVRTYTLVFFLRMIQVLSAYLPSFIGVVGLIVGLQPGNLTTFTVISFGLLFFAMPSRGFKDHIISIGKFIEDGSPELSTSSEDVSSFAGSDKDRKT